MQLTSGAFGALLQALRLTQGLYKPSPSPAGPSAYSNTLAADNPSGYGELSGDATDSSSAGDSFDDSCAWQPYDPLPLGDQTFPPFDQAKATVYRYRQQQSVNLGSWYGHMTI